MIKSFSFTPPTSQVWLPSVASLSLSPSPSSSFFLPPSFSSSLFLYVFHLQIAELHWGKTVSSSPHLPVEHLRSLHINAGFHCTPPPPPPPPNLRNLKCRQFKCKKYCCGVNWGFWKCWHAVSCKLSSLQLFCKTELSVWSSMLHINIADQAQRPVHIRNAFFAICTFGCGFFLSVDSKLY